MKNLTGRIKGLFNTIDFALAPLLFAVYPVLFLYLANIQEIPRELVKQPFLVVAAVSLAISLFVLITVKNRNKAALLQVMFWLFFFFYGPVFSFVDKPFSGSLGHHSLVLPIWILLFSFLTYKVVRSSFDFRQVIGPLTIVGAGLVALQIYGIISYSPKPADVGAFEHLANPDNQTMSANAKHKPNIYFIMPDSYPRFDVLKNDFKFDNSGFIDFLHSKDFFVATNSHSNYNQTSLSMPSTLNMSYVKNLPGDTFDKTESLQLYQTNKVLKFVKSGGYKYIQNTKLYSAKINKSADYNITCKTNNEFLNELSSFTPLSPANLVTTHARLGRRKDVFCVMDKTVNNSIKGPKFIFTHLFPPHPPFVFGRDGQDVPKANLSLKLGDRYQRKDLYVDQLIYVNKLLEKTVNAIQAKDKDAIIVIQSDHGTLSNTNVHDPNRSPLDDTRPVTLTERSRNLMAIHMPSYCDKSKLSNTATNVNTFRVIFNACFGAHYKMLDSHIYYVPAEQHTEAGYRDITKLVGN